MRAVGQFLGRRCSAERKRRVEFDLAKTGNRSGANACVCLEALDTGLYGHVAISLDDVGDLDASSDVFLADTFCEFLNKPRVAARHLVIHLVAGAGRIVLGILGQGAESGNVTDRFTKIGAVPEVAEDKVFASKTDVRKLRPPVLAVELIF